MFEITCHHDSNMSIYKRDRMKQSRFDSNNSYLLFILFAKLNSWLRSIVSSRYMIHILIHHSLSDGKSTTKCFRQMGEINVQLL